MDFLLSPLDTILIGIDPGTETGFAVYDTEKKALELVCAVTITQAMRYILGYRSKHETIVVYFEDARLRKQFFEKGREALQGAGSIKRDCSIWEQWLKEENIKYMAVAPANNRTKLSSGQFKMTTGWSKPTNNHGRDAAMLVYGRGRMAPKWVSKK